MRTSLYIPVVGYSSHHTYLGSYAKDDDDRPYESKNSLSIVSKKKNLTINYTTSRSIIEQTKSKQHE